MKTLLQRVSQASVSVDNQNVARIGPGLLVLLGIEKHDTPAHIHYHIAKLRQLRIFADEAGKMNRSIEDIQGDFLIISQFTLAGDCRKGNRPGFDNAMPPQAAKRLYETFLTHLQQAVPTLTVQSGIFGAHMQVSLTNDGPVTFWLEN